jgi:hypothetical protein
MLSPRITTVTVAGHRLRRNSTATAAARMAAANASSERGGPCRIGSPSSTTTHPTTTTNAIAALSVGDAVARQARSRDIGRLYESHLRL